MTLKEFLIGLGFIVAGVGVISLGLFFYIPLIFVGAVLLVIGFLMIDVTNFF